LRELVAAWDALGRETPPGAGWHARRVHVGAACRIQAALREPTGERATLLEVPAAAIPAGADFPDCAGFLLKVEPIISGPGGQVRLVLQERSPTYAELFVALAEDVARRAAGAPSSATAVAVVVARLAVWQRFVSDFGPGRLSDEARAGLVGELLALESLFLPRLSRSGAVAAWVGPSGAAQDFRLETCLVEIKASTAFSPASFRVSNLEQLSGDAGLPLFLCHVGLTADGSAARSLPVIVADLRSVFGVDPPDGLDLFEAHLFEAGYLDTFADAYSTPAYGLRGMRFFHVAEGFPLLTPGGVPSGILGATYSVSLGACEPWEVPAADCTSLIETANV
jgi:Putative  PD-(D/E)XK family member, (DUF4420)